MSAAPRRLDRVPAIKGSFPLDHEGECKTEMAEYMLCLHDNKLDNSQCRPKAMAYFQCRMERNLMDKDDWAKLGYGQKETNSSEKKEG